MNNGRVRIYELSKELNLENKDILAVCEQLEISVKSHSSTITEGDAERIRTVAKDTSMVNMGSASSGKSTQKSVYPSKRGHKARPPVKKQQILEVRSKHPSHLSDNPAKATSPKPPPRPNPPVLSQPSPRPTHPNAESTQATTAVNTAQKPASLPKAVLQAPPQRMADGSPVDPEPLVEFADEETAPVKEVSHVVDFEISQVETIEPEMRDSASPDEVAQSSSVSEASTSVAVAESAVPVAPNYPSQVLDSASGSVAPQKLSPQPPKSPRQAQPQPKTDSSNPTKVEGPQKPSMPKSKPSSKSPKLPSDKPRPEKPGTKKPDATPQVLELRRPRPVRPTADVPDKVSESDSQYFQETESSEEIPLTTTPAEDTDKLRPRRSVEPARSARKGKAWEEEENELEAIKKSAKAPGKAKRRPQIIEDDEDEDFADLGSEGATPVTVSLSLVRPPKPKGQEIGTQSKPVPTAATARKQRGDGNRENRQRRANRLLQETNQRPEKLVLRGGMTVQQLAEELVVPETEIIKNLFFKGIMATITQTLDIPTIEMVAHEYDVLVEEPEKQSQAKKVTEVLDIEDLDNLQHRPPVVTVMGHVDHGKTTLLDAIRKTRVAQGEAGGITQHIGAYHVDVEHNGKLQQVVFLDTPGHEAFTAMRARGTRVTDIAILVVAADDGVRPQTIEAISHAKAAEVPIIVAINKVDKDEAQPDRVKQELTEYGLLSEEWGGDTIMVPVSAIKGENLDTLLEMILLVAEIEELSANPDREAKGTVVEAHLDKARGPVASLLVQNGTLRVGDVLVAGSVFGKVRAMIDDQGNRVESAGPSIPVEVLGLSNVPNAGEEFQVYVDEKEARTIAIERAAEQRTSRLQRAMSSRRITLSSLSAQAQEGELKELNLLLKGDVQGSVEAIVASLEKLPQKEVQIRILLAAPGEVTETDVDLAAASGAVILGFNTTLASGSKRAADDAGVDVREYDVIYKLLEDVQGAMEGLLEPELVEEPLGRVEVRAVFPVGRGAVAGCYILSGKAIRNCNIRVHRGDEIVFTGSLSSLRRVKEDVKEVNAGYECGIGVDSFNDWKEGDIVETYRMVTKRRTLTT